MRAMPLQIHVQMVLQQACDADPRVGGPGPPMPFHALPWPSLKFLFNLEATPALLVGPSVPWWVVGS